MKKEYRKPSVESESVFETIAATPAICTHADPSLDAGCDPDFGGTLNP